MSVTLLPISLSKAIMRLEIMDLPMPINGCIPEGDKVAKNGLYWEHKLRLFDFSANHLILH